ncbi:hemerythrin domain-containing protein [Nocardioides sp.]|uniref:hemerythrin domain-containing protein n=1 Tax=Nocardioides sp. TaxID=35761 RepID=UPI0027327D82|nr:hemerythrin domain-containing protein [Nocardioides sp.]MDP3894800.1 hemerythrin domain-containing protein [Nocardioides sp.]
MTEMSMNRVIHGAVRRDLGRFVTALGTFPEGDQKRADELSTAWANFEDQLHHHHEGEHRIAWPALQKVGVSPELLATMDTEHDTMAAALTAAGAAMADLVRAPTRGHADSARAALEQLRTVTVTHLDHEERELEQVYLDNEDDPAIVEMGKAFAKISPVRAGLFFAWILDGASPAERAAVGQTIPGPVLTIITGVFGRGYRKNVAPAWR